MKRSILGGWMLWMLIGALMLLYTLLSAGVSFIYTPVAQSWTEAEAMAAETGISRPCREFRFETVIFSGLYLCSGDDATPTDWIMCGYIDGKFLPFYVPASDGEPPEDLQNVSYILRRPTPGNAIHSEWVVASLVDDIVDEGYYSTEQASYFFTTAVLQADRNGAALLLVLALCGVALIVVGSVFLGLRLRREPEPPPVIYAVSPGDLPIPPEEEHEDDPPMEDTGPEEEEPEEEEAEEDFGFSRL